ncbi:MAG: HEAT repeat domain-containing protein [Nitrospinota bacterium]
MLKKYRIQKILKNYIVLDDAGKKELIKQLAGFGNAAFSHVLDSVGRGQILPVDASAILSALYSPKFLDDYIALLAHPQGKIRNLLKQVINIKAGKQGVAALLNNFDHPIPILRSSVVDILKEHVDSGTVFQISQFLGNENRDVVRHSVELLGIIGGPEALDHLLSVFKKSDLQLKRKIVKLFLKNKELGAIDMLSELLETEKDPELLKLILDFFINVLERGADKKTVSAIQAHLTSNDLLIRQKAVDALGKAATAAIIPDVLSLLKGTDVNIRRSVVDILNMIKDPKAGEVLIHCIQDKDWWVREIATEALLKLSEQDDTIQKNLLPLLSAKDENTRRIVAEYFNQIVYIPAYQPLLKLLDDEDWWVREKAVSALGKMNNPEAIPFILEHIADTDIRAAIPEALGHIRSEKAVKALLSLLEQDDKVIRLAALKAVGKFDTPDVKDHIKIAVLDGESEISELALNLLEQKSGKKVSKYDIQLEISARFPQGKNNATVQPLKEEEGIGFSGDLSLFSLGEVIQNLNSTCKSGCLKLPEGKVYFNRGNIVHSEKKGDDNQLILGEEAVFALFTCTTGTFKFLVEEKSEQVTVKEPTMSIVLEAARRVDEKKR